MLCGIVALAAFVAAVAALVDVRQIIVVGIVAPSSSRNSSAIATTVAIATVTSPSVTPASVTTSASTAASVMLCQWKSQ